MLSYNSLLGGGGSGGGGDGGGGGGRGYCISMFINYLSERSRSMEL